jgi:glyoxylase-like metal-dependent hydrolase (beta-lactamase superfamily II)
VYGGLAVKITDRIHLVKAPMGTSFTGIYILLGEGVGIIDTGLADSPENAVFPYLKKLGHSPDEISLVVITHGHGDHYEGIPAITKSSDAEVAIHELDAPLITLSGDRVLFQNLRRQYPYAVKPLRGKPVPLPSADLLLRDGGVLDVAGTRLEVIHTPGHSLGAICLYEPSGRVLFTGDSVQGRSQLLYGSINEYLCSLQRLMNVKVDLLLAAHHYPPTPGAVLRGIDARSFLEASVEAVQESLDAVYALFKTSETPLSLEDVSRSLPLPKITAIKMIEKLGEDGKIRTVPPSPRWW